MVLPESVSRGRSGGRWRKVGALCWLLFIVVNRGGAGWGEKDRVEDGGWEGLVGEGRTLKVRCSRVP